MTKSRPCTYCFRPAFTGGLHSPLCEPHFDLWLVICHLRRLGLAVTAENVRAEMIRKTATGYHYSFELEQIPDLLAQMAVELQPKTHTAALATS